MLNTLHHHFRQSLIPGLCYLNAGTHSFSPDRVVEAREAAARDFDRNPTRGLFGAWERLWTIGSTLAHHFGAEPEGFFLRPNVTQALNDFILNAELNPKKNEILVTSQEYGAIVNTCRLRARRDGLKLRVFEVPPASALSSPQALLAAILAEVREETGILLVSHITTSHGLIFPIKELGAALAAQNVAVVIDGAHGPGALALNLGELPGISFYGGNFHKWFMGAKGASFGYVAPEWRERVRAPFGSWTVDETPETFAGYGDGSRFAARMLQSACQNFSSYFALPAALAFWHEVGHERIWAELAEMGVRVRAAMAPLESQGFVPVSPRSPGLAGPLYTWKLPERYARMEWTLMSRLLEEAGVQVVTTQAEGHWALRLSPHIHLSEESLEEGLRRLIRWLDSH